MKKTALGFVVLLTLLQLPAFSQSKNKKMVTTEEKLHLMELIAGYSLASDNKDVSAHMAYYSPDGYIDGGMKTGTRSTTMATDLAQIFAMEGTLKRHFALNHQFSKAGNDIHVDYLLLVVEGEQLPGVLASAQIHDEFIRIENEWKLKKHLINIDPAMFNLMKQWQEQQNTDQKK
jgi:hypothetical protein